VKVLELGLFALYVMLIAVAESLTTFTDPVYGVSLHAIILISLLVLSALRPSGNPSSLFLSLSLAPLIRIISLSLPLAYFPRYAWYLVAGLAVLLATVTLMRVEGLGFREVGVTLSRPLTQAAVGLTGIPFGVIEYHILRPEPLTVGSLFENFLLAIALIFFTGFAEELVFRGVMQRSAVEVFGWKAGVLGVNVVFSILHIGWLSILDVLFVFTIGLFFGFMTFKTGSIVGVSLSHGLTNVFLFLVMPAR
jgi:membrane protease YdiL (CAAX protease family)